MVGNRIMPSSALIGASPKEIVFTSGATESNNISIKGGMNFYREKKRHLITTQTEHKCVLDSCRHLQQRVGFDITYLPVGSDGIVDLEKLRSVIRPDTGLVSVMAVNNEIGVIQPLEEIGKICKEFNVPFHTDAAQALGEIPIDLEKWNVSLKSIGALNLTNAFLRRYCVAISIKCPCLQRRKQLLKRRGGSAEEAPCAVQWPSFGQSD
ncbi:Cysteine desulfurase, mitochondrial, partial [Cucurbita argyrosperma subsp. sororia]